MDLPESQEGSTAAKMYRWDQPEEGRLGTLLSLEEQILDSMFEACDPQRTGTVAVTHVLAYLEAVTGRGPQDARLQTLASSLDPNGEGPQATVDLDTFLVVMRDWIAACQLDGGLELEEETAFEGALTSQQLPSGCSEAEDPANLESFGGEDPRPELPATADLLSSLEDLELSNRRLAGENAKLQRSVETAEEGSARLGEEILALRKQLRSTQQAVQFAKAMDEELEDLKTLAKSLEEQNRSLLAQARQMEKEQQHLVAEIETLQEENGKLLAERDGVKRRSEELATEKDALKRQLHECERLICQRDTILSERIHHAESLAKTLEEYRTTTQELRLEISHLEEQLSQTHEGLDELPEGTQVRRVDWTKLPPPSLGVEIQAIQQKQEVTASNLSNPLCGIWQWEEVVNDTDEEAEFPPEAPTEGQRNFQGEPAHPHEGRNERSMWLPRTEEEEEAEIRVTVDPPIPLGDSHPEDIPGSPPESSPSDPELQQALVPVVKELVPIRRPVWGQLCLCPLHPQQLRCTPRHLQKKGGSHTSGHCRDIMGSPGCPPKRCRASPQGHSAPTDPGASPGPAAAAAALGPASGPVPAPHLAPPPALLPPASSSVSHAPHRLRAVSSSVTSLGLFLLLFLWLFHCDLGLSHCRDPRYSAPGSTSLYWVFL
ncbi:protein KASH5 isoform X2 [Hippopotamus amphibius kiboko]|uniref:protein KASH5 isoform X2 n=1 Tax=Hippopotamus amphibius kiboko TaxID=575201 RepID=UPI00259430B4|nr:protein KASH5 isoform X2 [Hippopotamus amphibius kiboko]